MQDQSKNVSHPLSNYSPNKVCPSLFQASQKEWSTDKSFQVQKTSEFCFRLCSLTHIHLIMLKMKILSSHKYVWYYRVTHAYHESWQSSYLLIGMTNIDALLAGKQGHWMVCYVWTLWILMHDTWPIHMRHHYTLQQPSYLCTSSPTKRAYRSVNQVKT